jgi:RimJ/RimL family protein N-acetyltransferase
VAAASRAPRIETARLVLAAAPAAAARAMRDGDRTGMERLLVAAVPDGWPDEELAGILPAYLDRLAADPGELGYGVWVVTTREPPVIVGSAGFLGPPDGGAIELGYGIHPAYRNAGYATEAAGALVRWALGRDGVREVLAECEPRNAASIRVLEKVGMRRTGMRGDLIAWAASAPA